MDDKIQIWATYNDIGRVHQEIIVKWNLIVNILELSSNEACLSRVHAQKLCLFD